MKGTIIFFAILLGVSLLGQSAFAKSKPKVEVTIISPTKIKDYPGKETNIIAEVTNHSDQPIKNVIVYVTMADMGKKWTVNLEDYSADKPIQVKELKAGETKKVSLPIQFVYTSKYHLYVTAASADELDIYSSNSIPIEIIGNTKIDPMIVQIVSILTPLLILLLVMWKFTENRRRVT